MIDSMIRDLLRMMVYQNITSPLFGAISSGLGSLFGGAASIPATTGPAVWVAKGNVFQGGNVIPFARGGIVDRPTVFPMARGAGLMGEAGPEAILPLTRTSSGNLGVEAVGGGTVNNYFVISSPDAEGFDRLCQRNAISIVRATNAALAKNVGRKEMRGLLGG
jgi:lambda family phage tail tape measure protein